MSLAAVVGTIAGMVLPILGLLVPYSGLTLSLAGLLSMIWLAVLNWYGVQLKKSRGACQGQHKTLL